MHEVINLIHKYKSSDHFRKAVNNLLKDPKALSEPQIMETRNSLMTRILLQNGQRAGVVRNRTVAEFRAASREGPVRLVRVKHHKTFSTYGSARIVMNQVLYSHVTLWLRILSHITRGTSSSEGGLLFTNLRGGRMTSNSVAKATSSAFQNPLVTPTRLRKAIVVIVS